MIKEKNVYIRCDDNAETAVFTKVDVGLCTYYELAIEDSYCGRGDCMGIKGRFKRAWHAFWAKPIYYSGICCEDDGRMKKFLEDCLRVVGGDE